MGGVIDAIVDIGKSIVGAVSGLVKGLTSAFTSPFGTSFDSPDSAYSDSQAIQGVLVNKDSAISNIPVVYGTRMVGGTRVFVSTNGDNNKYLYLGFVLAEGQCNAYTKLLIDDTEVPLVSYAHGVQSNASSGRYKDKLLVQFFDGRDNQIASTLLDEAPNWTSDHKLSGLCYVAFRFEWLPSNPTQEQVDNNPYGGGVPDIKIVLQGKKIYDATTGYSAQTVGSITGSTGLYFNETLDQSTFLSQTITRTSQTTNFSYGYNNAADNFISFTLNQTADVVFNYSGDIQLSGTLQTDGQVAVTSTVQLRKLVSGTYTLTANTFKAVNFYVDNGRNQDSLAVTAKRTRAETVSVSLAAGTYRFYGVTNTVTVNASQAHTVNFQRSLQIIIPAVSSAHATAYASETVAFNNNPANVLLDYLRNPRYGKGLSNDVFDWESFVTAGKLCDQVVTYTSVTTGKAFTCDAVIDTAQSLMTNVKILLTGFRGILPYQQGLYVLKIEHGGDDTDIDATPTTPVVVFTVTEDEIVGGLNIQGEDKESKINRCRVTYVDPDADYQPNEAIWPEDGGTEDIAYLDEDTVRLEKSITLTTVANREQAIQYAEVYVKRSRSGKQLSFLTTIASSNTTVGDLIRVINNKIGLDGVFRVSDIRIQPTGEIEVLAIEHQSSNYAIIAKDTDITRPVISLPDPLTVGAVTALTVVSGAAYNELLNTNAYVETNNTNRRLYVSWTAPVDPFTSRYIVQYKVNGVGSYVTWTTTSAIFTYINFVVLGTAYDVRVAAINSLDRRSAYLAVTAHTVIA